MRTAMSSHSGRDQDQSHLILKPTWNPLANRLFDENLHVEEMKGLLREPQATMHVGKARPMHKPWQIHSQEKMC
jgi:hypothetical protein